MKKVLYSTLVALLWLGGLEPRAVAEEIRYIEQGGVWSYFLGEQEASSPDLAAWRLPGFDATSWESGPAPFGYDDGPFGTDLSTLDPPMEDNYSTLFLRYTFEVSNPGSVVKLEADVNYDDGFVMWINGVEVLRANAGQPGDPVSHDGFAAGNHESGTFEHFDLPAPDGYMVAGTNVVAVMVFNTSLGSSDLKFDIDLIDPIGVDTSPPLLSALVPAAGVTVRSLSSIEVTFNEVVSGVDLGDLLVNGSPADSISGSGRGPYMFSFAALDPGAVNVAWIEAHGIEDAADIPNPFGGGSWSYTIDPDAPSGEIVINEVMAANANGLRDEDNERPDWFEIVNNGTTIIDLAGWSATDEAGEPGKWVFPSRALGPGEYLVVFASGKDRRPGAGNLHTNFQLNADGEYIGIFSPDSPRQVVDEIEPQFPLQRSDISYGRDGVGTLSYFENPTPGDPNDTGSTLQGVLANPAFSVRRGFYIEPFDLEISTDTPGATIRYRTDGRDPTATSGTTYTAPISIVGTSSKAVISVKAIVSRSGYLPSEVVTHTFIFPEYVPDQPDRPSGFPTSWGGAPSVDYGMDPEVVDDARYRDRIVPALLSIPTISMVGEVEDIFGGSGLYSNTTRRGVAYERAVSVEMLHPHGKDGFAINCGARIQGGASRNPGKSPKHSFRLLFKGDYGPTKLRHALFPDTHIESFDQVILRAGYNNSWIHWDNGQRRRSQYIRDQWVRDTLLDMGRVSSHGSYVHLYLNGLYWGLYNLVERPNAAFAASYLGGDKEEYDALNSGDPIDGDKAAYNTMMGIAGRDLSSNANYQLLEQHLHIPNLIDYMITNFFGGNDDWPGHNWYAGTRRNGGLYRYYSWDAERIFESVSKSRIGASNGGSPGYPFERLRANAEFRLRVGDHVNRHFFNNGALTKEQTAERWEERARTIEEAVVAESARWGDYRRDVHSSSNGPYEFYRPHSHWEPERNRLLSSYFPQRSNVVLNQLKSANLYPDVGAPLLSHGGGNVNAGFELTLSRPSGTTGTIYFTLNGVDPRQFGTGEVMEDASPYSAPIAINGQTVVKARIQSGARWSALSEAVYTVPSLYAGLQVSELMYHAVGGREFEFVELHNAGGTSLSLGGLRFSDGIDYSFGPGAWIAGGGYVVLVADADKFAERYSEVPIGGVYGGALDNGGERLELEDLNGNVILSFRYDDEGGWPVASDGFGRSLVLRAGAEDLNHPESWSSSAEFHGYPGGENPLAPLPAVVINEVLTRSTAPYEDAVELYNPTGEEVDLGGWFLSDDRDDEESLKKYRIPDGTVLSPGEYVVFYEGDFNPTPGEGTSFGLDGSGESVYLSAADAPTGILEGYITELDFAGSEENVSQGRVPTSRGGDLTALGAPSFGVSNPVDVASFRTGAGAANEVALVGPVVLHEIHYHPREGKPEFIELYNLTGETVSLHDAEVGRGWQLRGVSNAADTGSYEFPPGAALGPFGYALVIPTSADMFRLSYPALAEEVPLFGPYSGGLDNGGERLRLLMPDAIPAGETEVPYIVIDRVIYGDEAPWPSSADGLGSSLERREPSSYGNEPLNWGASTRGDGTPGEQNSVGPPPPNRPPTARFTATPEFGPAPLEVTLNASRSSDPEGVIVSYTWNFGDGESGSGKVLSHTYQSEGEYEVELTVEDLEGLISSVKQTLVVAVNVAPVARFTLAPQSGPAPLRVQVDGSSSEDLDGSVVSYRWDFGDGVEGSGASLSHTYQDDGEYELVLTVEDNGGLTSQTSQMVSVRENLAPVAVFTMDPPGGEYPVEVSFDASASRDPDGEIVLYSWDFGDGQQGAGESVRHTYTRAGEFMVTLNVQDDLGRSGFVIEQLTVREPGVNEAPEASFTATPQSGPAPLEVRFDASASRDPDGEIVLYSWDFGDGQQGSGAVVTHTYTSGGEYRVILSVLDDRNTSTEALGSVRVEEPGGQVPGDCNQDGNLDISDASCLLGYLFLGKPERLPCEGGTKEDAGNVLLLNVNGDEGVDLTDAVYVLGFLFQGGPEPTLGTGCVPMSGCPLKCQ